MDAGDENSQQQSGATPSSLGMVESVAPRSPGGLNTQEAESEEMGTAVAAFSGGDGEREKEEEGRNDEDRDKNQEEKEKGPDPEYDLAGVYFENILVGVEQRGPAIGWAGFRFEEMHGQLATRTLDPNQLQEKKATTITPSILYREPRFASGRAFRYMRTRLGLLLGHYLRVIDFINSLGTLWLQQALLALTAELHETGYRYKYMARALSRVTNP